ncbi:hypothetical protein C8R44DRAFT_826298 [Mycena epipterygia]|nr:hypothetical protein C8R44DRAFT_826298 [Mycena epipterygia]
MTDHCPVHCPPRNSPHGEPCSPWTTPRIARIPLLHDLTPPRRWRGLHPTPIAHHRRVGADTHACTTAFDVKRPPHFTRLRTATQGRAVPRVRSPSARTRTRPQPIFEAESTGPSSSRTRFSRNPHRRWTGHPRKSGERDA